jgi:UDP-N-acetylmuramyl pentapeptide synthase
MATPIPANAAEFTLAEIAGATGGEASGDGALKVCGVSIDTRNLARGALFVALRGVADGHKFLAQAAERGADRDRSKISAPPKQHRFPGLIDASACITIVAWMPLKWPVGVG